MSSSFLSRASHSEPRVIAVLLRTPSRVLAVLQISHAAHVSRTALSHGLSVIGKAIALDGFSGVAGDDDVWRCCRHHRASERGGEDLLRSRETLSRPLARTINLILWCLLRPKGRPFLRITGASDVADVRAAPATASLALEGSLSSASAERSRSSSLCSG